MGNEISQLIPEEHYSIPELAQMTGESEAAWRRRIRLRQITYVKCGSNVRVSHSDFRHWLELRTVVAEQGPRGVKTMSSRTRGAEGDR
jgi:hypothetical protein